MDTISVSAGYVTLLTEHNANKTRIAQKKKKQHNGFPEEHMKGTTLSH